jgi:MOSC domain-containing protein YiiM
MQARVVEILSSSAPGAPLMACAAAVLEAGRGLAGDRYHAGAGTFSARLAGKPDAELTLIEAEAIERFNQSEGLTLKTADFRRNIVTRGVALNELVGVEFRVGGALLRGLRLCEPCAHLARVANQKVLPGMVHAAGLRAQILVGATIHPGDPVVTRAAG